jgi:hypothetical protein
MKICEDILKGNGTYIIKSGKTFYYADVEFNLTREMTLKEWSVASSKYIRGCLCLNGDYSPQWVSIYSVDDAIKTDDILNELAKDISVTKDDVCMPLIGGIIGDSFKQLYQKLLNVSDATDKPSIWDYRRALIAHYKPLFEARKPEVEKETSHENR